MSKLILMLGHQARVGKDTLANELEARNGFKRIAFADKLKEVCMDLYDLSYEQMYGDLKNTPDERFQIDLTKMCWEDLLKFSAGDPTKVIFYTPRQILQYVGQSLFTIDPAIWVKYACKKALDYDKIVFTDFRFFHEVEAVKKFFADYSDINVVTIKIIRDGIGDFTGKMDRSEIELSEYDWDYIINNNGTIEQLYRQAASLIG